MKNKASEILFNKNGRNEIIKKDANDAKRIIGLMEEHCSHEKSEHLNIINLYSKKITHSVHCIENKLEENKLRPFEFLVHNN